MDVLEKGLSTGGAKNNKIGLPYPIYADTMKSANRAVLGVHAACSATASRATREEISLFADGH